MRFAKSERLSSVRQISRPVARSRASTIPAIPRSLRRAAHWVGDIAEWSALDVALLGGTASILGALLVGLVDHFYFNIEFPHMAALFWLTVALTMSARRLLSEGIESEPPRAIQSNNKEANKGSADHMLAP